MSNLIDKLLGRYFLAFILSALICWDMNWAIQFGILVGCFFAGGISGLIWGKKDVESK